MLDTEKKYKFELGQIVKHKADNKATFIKMLIIAKGIFVDEENNTTKMYMVSFVRKQYIPNEATFSRTFLDECEIELVPSEKLSAYPI